MYHPCCMQVFNRNGVSQDHLTEKYFVIEIVCKGGFRFLSEEKLDLQGRVAMSQPCFTGSILPNLL